MERENGEANVFLLAEKGGLRLSPARVEKLCTRQRFRRGEVRYLGKTFRS